MFGTETAMQHHQLMFSGEIHQSVLRFRRRVWLQKRKLRVCINGSYGGHIEYMGSSIALPI